MPKKTKMIKTVITIKKIIANSGMDDGSDTKIRKKTNILTINIVN